MVQWRAAGADILGCAMRGKKVRQIVDFCYSSDSATRATANVIQSYFGEMALRDSILEKPLRRKSYNRKKLPIAALAPVPPASIP
jgi:hypothetical protein